MPRSVLVAVLTVALVATGGAVATAGGAPLSFSGITDWFGSLFTEENVGPTAPPETQTVIPDDDTGELGREAFFQYASQPSGAGSQMLVNLHTGNALFAYDPIANPSRGHATFVRLTYNSLDHKDGDDSLVGEGWSLSATTLTRLGTPLDFHPPGLSWPTTVTLVDGDGTEHVFRLNKHDTSDQSKWDYDHPPGVHLFLQKAGGTDPTRAWVMTKPDRTRFYFDDEGNQTATADRNRNELRFTYVAGKHNDKPTRFLQSITDPAGRTTLAVAYFAKGDTYTFVDDDGNVVTQDDLHNPHIIDKVKSITDVDGRRMEFAYTDKGLLARLVDAAGTPLAKTFRFTYNNSVATPNTRLVKVTDPRGAVSQLDYFDAHDVTVKGLVKSMTDRLGGVTAFKYVDSDGPRSSTLDVTVTDALAHATQFVIDGRGRPVRVTDAKGQLTELGWDIDNNLVRLREPNGATATAIFDQNTGYPLEIADAEANANQTPPTKMSYRTALAGHVADLATSASPEGRTWSFGYDDNGNVISATDPAGTASPAAGDFTTTNTYDASGQLVTTTDANGHITRFADYDATGAPRATTDALGRTTTMAYDARGNPVSLTDARGKTSTFSFDLLSRPLESRVPKNAAAGDLIVTPAPVYDANDNVVESTTPTGARTTANYDAGDRMVTTLAPRDTADGPERRTSYVYDAVGNLLTLTEPNGSLTADANDFVTRYSYDEIYQVIAVTDARGGVTSYVYDNAGNQTMAIDPRKNATADPADFTTKVSYDRNHRARTATDAAGFTNGFDYDRDGLVVATTDEEGNKSLLAYDARGLLTESREPHDTVDGAIVYQTTRYEYDQVGNRIRTVSPRGVATADDPADFAQVSVFDELNRVKEQILPFDKDDPTYTVGETVRYSYDEVGNLIKVSQPTSGKVPGADGVRVDTTHTFFDNGWIASTTDAFGIATTYDYNALGEQTRRTTTGADGGLSHTMTLSYYPDGKLNNRTDEGVPAGSNVLLWDNVDERYVQTVGEWPTSSQGTGFFGTDYATHAPGTGTNTFTWEAPSRHTAGDYEVFVRYPAVDGAATDAEYKLFNQATRTVDQTQHAGEWVSLGRFHIIAATEFDKVTLSDDANGIVVADAIKFVRDTSDTVDDERQSFTYVYDANGNLTSISDQSSGTHVDGYAMSYTGLNQLSKLDELAGGAVAHTSTYSYDANGNLTSRTLDSLIDDFEYDVRNLVTKVTNFALPGDIAAKVSTYAYTARGQLSKQTKPLASTVDYSYFADGRPRHMVETGETGLLLAEHTLDYDLNGNPTRDVARLMSADDANAHLDRTLTYQFDPRDRVVQVDKGGERNEKYFYDANSNILSQVFNEPGGKKTTAANFYDRNRLTRSFTGSPNDDGTTTTTESSFYYDPLGRTEQIRTRSIVSGGGNPTTPVVEGFAWYTYDGFDRKVEHQVNPFGPFRSVTTYAYDTLNRTTASSRKILAFTDNGEQTRAQIDSAFRYLGASDQMLSDERTSGSDTTRTTYRYGAGGERVSQRVATTDGGPSGEFNYTYDARGDVEAITEPGGKTRATYGYTAYGQDDESLFTGVDKPDPNDEFNIKRPVNVYRFSGQRWDQASGTYDFGFRDYSPTATRFLTPDFYTGAVADLRLGLMAGTANRYGFAAGNPIANIDINGHFAIPNWLKQVGGFFKGLGEQAWETVTGVWHEITCLCLIDELSDALEAAVDDPGEFFSAVWHSIWDPIAADWNAGNYGEAIGRGTFAVAELVFGGKGLSKIKNLIKARRAAAAETLAAAPAATAAAAATARLPQDIAIQVLRPTPRPAKITGRIGRSPTQHARLQADIQAAIRAHATDIRVNQHQVNAAGVRVGINRPDLQYTLNGVRHYIEYETTWPGRWPAHQARILANDPLGNVIGLHVP
jgi:RHS repeat-associated protein